MALPVKDQMRYWGVVAFVFVLILWALGDVLLPFVIGGAIAYFLDPVADRLERLGLSRMAATAIITVVGILGFVLAILMVVPALITQLLDLVDVMPELFKQLRGFVEKQFPSLLDRESSTHQMLVSFGETLKSKTGDVLQTVLTSLGSAINIVVLLVIVPVVAVYLLLDWDRMIARIGELLPRDHAPTIKRLASEIDAVLASFVRGMGTVCLILGTYYAVALMLAGLQFGLIVGFIAGLVTFIPYLGALIGGTLAIGLALFQFWGDWAHIGLIAGIFAIGQVTEGNFLTPKLVGNSVGLHPVWLLLALSVFGALFGFVGMLVAVPVAAALGVLARFGTSLYLDSRLYTGLESQDQETE
ncbi:MULTISPECIES: AI-2E family transporter [unclassified Ruegeria]|uniref:AI-2E family transporter n=1 Tax=unclassified Ruegeria TaxID=2625375 RepID=UPI00148858B3|nr:MULTISPECIES: AI-2E family transporter [unclassified Ruegeria]NOD74689.1 AI-2E family transporter [Ruegeria sp. HKCCD4332]NOD88577.1 AI-2E family transporter [Ruegeria sp. HKCCD4318]NOE12195.1 AI-2E family transporter [Ruegeria sp. HKCCD4318-2]NOG09640.1 AI-2E family transporter [Ruegeria sp. HKCCD4315]